MRSGNDFLSRIAALGQAVCAQRAERQLPRDRLAGERRQYDGQRGSRRDDAATERLERRDRRRAVRLAGLDSGDGGRGVLGERRDPLPRQERRRLNSPK